MGLIFFLFLINNKIYACPELLKFTADIDKKKSSVTEKQALDFCKNEISSSINVTYGKTHYGTTHKVSDRYMSEEERIVALENFSQLFVVNEDYVREIIINLNLENDQNKDNLRIAHENGLAAMMWGIDSIQRNPFLCISYTQFIEFCLKYFTSEAIKTNFYLQHFSNHMYKNKRVFQVLFPEKFFENYLKKAFNYKGFDRPRTIETVLALKEITIKAGESVGVLSDISFSHNLTAYEGLYEIKRTDQPSENYYYFNLSHEKTNHLFDLYKKFTHDDELQSFPYIIEEKNSFFAYENFNEYLQFPKDGLEFCNTMPESRKTYIALQNT